MKCVLDSQFTQLLTTKPVYNKTSYDEMHLTHKSQWSSAELKLLATVVLFLQHLMVTALTTRKSHSKV